MAFLHFLSLIFLVIFYYGTACATAVSSVTKSKERSNLQTYVIHVKQPEGGVFSQSEDREKWHRSFLTTTTASLDKQPRLVYSYQHVISGFAARLTSEDVKAMAEKDGFVSAHAERMFHPLTTHTPNFLGLYQQRGLWQESNFGKGMIIGVLDGGILPSHPSFSDEGMPPPPYAHLAIYKVCFGAPGDDCPESDILAGLDAAVEDGVDVVSLSLGSDSVPFFNDSVAVGSFAAIQKGIFVSCAAGNSGPFNSTSWNEAPWVLTVGASTIDRSIVSTAKLGNGEEFDGQSVFQPADFPSTQLSLVYPGINGKPDSVLCAPGSLNDTDLKRKVVLCERGGGIGRIAKGEEVKSAGGAAMILMNDEPNAFSTIADPHVLPATHVSYAAGLKIKAYINSTASPSAAILFKGTVIGDSLAPIVASFSSRGPNRASPGILQPDIIGPGVSILAAWPFPLDNSTNSKSTFNIMSGTSMSCPHLSGIAALLKSSHPHWSPAAIKSAIMTSADTHNLEGKPIVDETLQPADVFATSAGHVNPSRANDPGLVYDIQPNDYIPYLCGLGYKNEEVGILAHRKINCSEVSSIPEGELNYPSFTVALGPSQTFTRTVTNVGEAYSTYAVYVAAPEGVYVTVEPTKLYFSEVKQKLKYTVTFSRTGSATDSEYGQGYLKWVSAKHSVRSPISVRFK